MKSEEEKWDICHNVIHKILNKRIQKLTFHKHIKIFFKKYIYRTVGRGMRVR